ncbi:hypothetical protein D3C72_1524150 [compost metagenome]
MDLVGDFRLQDGVPEGLHGLGLGVEDAQDEGDVVGAEAPEDVLLVAKLAEREAAAADVLDLAQFALADEVHEGFVGGVVLEDMPDHEDAAERIGGLGEVLGLVAGEGEGLFDEDVLAGLHGLHGEAVVGAGGGGDDDGLEGVVLEDVLEVGVGLDVGVLGVELREDVGAAVADGSEGSEGVEVADEVGAPVAASDDGDVLRGGQSSPSLRSRSWWRSGCR